MLFVLIILLLWIHPVTDQHPTCVATKTSVFMATGSFYTVAWLIAILEHRSQGWRPRRGAVQESDLMTASQSFTVEHKRLCFFFKWRRNKKCLFRNISWWARRILEVTAVQKVSHQKNPHKHATVVIMNGSAVVNVCIMCQYIWCVMTYISVAHAFLCVSLCLMS